MEIDLDFDISVTGFELPEIDVLIGGLEAKPPRPTRGCGAGDGGSAPSRASAISGRSARIASSAATRLDPETTARLLEGEKAQLVFTDPPYNVPIEGHVSGLGRVRHREFAMATGEMTEAEFTGFLRSVFANLVEASVDGAIHFIAMDWRHVAEVMTAAGGIYAELKNLCVWSKTNGGMGSLYRSQHELFFVFKSGTAPHINNVELGKHGRYRTNVWSYAGANSFSATRDDDLAMHPTVKPVALVADAILDCSHRKGDRARRLRGIGHDAGRGAQDRAARLRHRTRPALL